MTEPEEVLQQCGGCRFFMEDKAVEEGGVCRFLPYYFPKSSTMWCGQFQPRQSKHDIIREMEKAAEEQ